MSIVVSPEQVHQIVNNLHHDPFEVLGAHPLEEEGKVNKWVVSQVTIVIYIQAISLFHIADMFNQQFAGSRRIDGGPNLRIKTRNAAKQGRALYA
ncbi:MAG: 1,4-alpha-glucan branching enzyme [Cyanobacteriota bacterium]